MFIEGNIKTKALRDFIAANSVRLKGISIEADGVFIYTDSSLWCDDAGAGTFRGDTETAAVKRFYANVRQA